MSWKTVRGNSIALRLSALFILVALGVFVLMNRALKVDLSLLKLTDIGGRDIVAIHFYRGFDF